MVSESYNGICRYELFEKQRHILVTCLLSVAIPLVIMGVLYGLMAIEARKQVRRQSCIISGGPTTEFYASAKARLAGGEALCYPAVRLYVTKLIMNTIFWKRMKRFRCQLAHVVHGAMDRLWGVKRSRETEIRHKIPFDEISHFNYYE